jgi:hypothetical protein
MFNFHLRAVTLPVALLPALSFAAPLTLTQALDLAVQYGQSS